MTDRPPADLVRAALTDTGITLTPLPGRAVTSGLLEVKELGPSLSASLVRTGLPQDRVALNYTLPIADWTRATSEVDLVVLDPSEGPELAVELKVWDIGHQLFDLAKLCCLLAAGTRAASMICVAKRRADFERLPGGELFPPTEGDTRVHDFVDLVARHRDEWLRHTGKGWPEPTTVPAGVSTTAITAEIPIHAYPGHVARAVQIAVTDATPVAARGLA